MHWKKESWHTTSLDFFKTKAFVNSAEATFDRLSPLRKPFIHARNKKEKRNLSFDYIAFSENFARDFREFPVFCGFMNLLCSDDINTIEQGAICLRRRFALHFTVFPLRKNNETTIHEVWREKDLGYTAERLYGRSQSSWFASIFALFRADG